MGKSKKVYADICNNKRINILNTLLQERLNRKTFFIAFLSVMTIFVAVQPLGYDKIYGVPGNGPWYENQQWWGGITLALVGRYIYYFPLGLIIKDAINAPVWFLSTFGLLTIALSLCIRRLHDIGLSGWYSFIWILFLASTFFIWPIAVFITPIGLVIIGLLFPLILALVPGKTLFTHKRT